MIENEDRARIDLKAGLIKVVWQFCQNASAQLAEESLHELVTRFCYRFAMATTCNKRAAHS